MTILGKTIDGFIFQRKKQKLEIFHNIHLYCWIFHDGLMGNKDKYKLGKNVPEIIKRYEKVLLDEQNEINYDDTKMLIINIFITINSVIQYEEE